jgi:hypothetical protein
MGGVYISKLLLSMKEPPDQTAFFTRRKAAEVDPAAGATISDANVRPYRGGAAAASDGDGRTVGHGRGS